jgi:hypothetical protein
MKRNLKLLMLALVASAIFLGGCKPFGHHHKEYPDLYRQEK